MTLRLSTIISYMIRAQVGVKGKCWGIYSLVTARSLAGTYSLSTARSLTSLAVVGSVAIIKT